MPRGWCWGGEGLHHTTPNHVTVWLEQLIARAKRRCLFSHRQQQEEEEEQVEFVCLAV